MKSYRARGGPVSERPYYKLPEIEQICTDALRKVGLYPEKPEPIRIERFVEKHFKISPEYHELPDGLLGYTKFGPRGVEQIAVSRSLAEQGDRVAERQVSSTLAHEAGHGLLQGEYSAEIATDSGANRHALRRKSAVREVGAKRRWDFVHSLSVV